MKAIDLVMYGVVSVGIALGIVMLFQYQDEQELLEDEAMNKMAFNLDNLANNQTNCDELYESLNKTEHEVLFQSIERKLLELGC